MYRLVIPAVLMMLAAPTLAMGQGQWTQLTIRQRIIIRVPRMSRPVATPMTPPTWTEKRGPRCLSPLDLAGALITTVGSVDLVLIGGQRMRARLDRDCRPLDYYSGFYVKPGVDGQVCANRDSIRVRSGAACRITAFRALSAQR